MNPTELERAAEKYVLDEIDPSDYANMAPNALAFKIAKACAHIGYDAGIRAAAEVAEVYGIEWVCRNGVAKNIRDKIRAQVERYREALESVRLCLIAGEEASAMGFCEEALRQGEGKI